jgi:hypothetical protein
VQRVEHPLYDYGCLKRGTIMANVDYLTRLLAPSEQQYGANAPATQDMREQFENAKKEETNPPKPAATGGGISETISHERGGMSALCERPN